MPDFATLAMSARKFIPVIVRPRVSVGRGMLYVMIFSVCILAVLVREWVKDDAGYSAQTKGLATFVLVLGVTPTILFLMRGDFRAIPFFEGHCLFYALSFGYAGFRPVFASGRLEDVGEADLVKGLLAAMIGLIMLFIGFYAVGGLLFQGVRQFTLKIDDSKKGTPLFLLAGFIVTILLGLLGMLGLHDLIQVAVAVWSFTILMFGTCVYANYLARWARFLFWLAFVPWMLVIGSGLLDNGQIGGIIEYAIWQTICAFWARGRPSAAWLVLAMVAVLLLQPIKGVYRNFIWGGSQFTRSDQVQMLSDMLKETGSAYQSSDKEDTKALFETSFARMNHLVVTAGVIRDTPAEEPFQRGETYYPLLVKWIPRMLWPDKPIEDLGNRWARRYGYLGSTDFNTSFNLPWLTEMYMNFGWWGVFFVPLMLGTVFRGLWAKFAQAPRNMVDFAFGMSVLASLIVVESHMSMKLGGLIVHSIGLFLVLVVLRICFKFLNIQTVDPHLSLRSGP
jgi:hypothetical protein